MSDNPRPKSRKRDASHEGRGPASRSIHAGERKVDGALNTPIYQSAAFLYGPYLDATDDTDDVWYYSRAGNPSLDAVEQKLNELTGAQDTLITASGMGAISTGILSCVASGDHIIASNSIYGETLSFLGHLQSQFGVELSWVSPETFADEARELVSDRTRLFYLETPTNPTLRLVDLPPVANLANEVDATTILDATFGSPVGQDPLGAGIDLVAHSATKFIGGHSDVVAGSIGGDAQRMARVRKMALMTGPVCDPHTAFLLSRGLKTLPLRWERHCSNALGLAQHLSVHTKVRRVHYPGLEDHPQSQLASQSMNGGGGVLSFELSDTGAADRFVRAVTLISWAPSLGSAESLVHVPAGRAGSHGHWSVQERAAAGIVDGLVRIAVGLEDLEDLMNDVDQALEQV